MLLVLLPTLLVLGQASDSPTQRDQELRRILEELDIDSRATRERAIAALQQLTSKLGPKAKVKLRKYAKKAPPEVRARIYDELVRLTRIPVSCQEILEAFEVLDLPDIEDRRLVLYNTGIFTLYEAGAIPKINFRYALGWVLSESEQEITLSENRLVVRSYRRSWKPPEKWDELRAHHPSKKPLPLTYKVIDFPGFCRKLLNLEKWTYFGDDPRHFARHSWYYAYALEPALYGWWALKRSHKKAGLELLALAETSIRTRPGRVREERPFAQVLTEATAHHLRETAIKEAKELAPRKTLLGMWEDIARLPHHGFTEEAKETAGLYRKEVAEDAQWAPLSPEELARRSPAERTAYWLFRLRDHAPTLPSGSHGVHVLREGPLSYLPDGHPDAAQGLVDLGWEALPALIEHFDDPRPTRAIAYWTTNHGSYPSWIMTVGDLCHIIYDKITGFDESGWRTQPFAQDRDDRIARSKKKAGAWWGRAKRFGPSPHYLGLLESKGKMRFSARRLLEVDREAHLPFIIKLAEGSTWEERRALLYVLLPHLGKEHQSFLKTYLEDPEDSYAVPYAARALWERFSDDSGIRELLGRIGRLRPKEGTPGAPRRPCCCCFLRGAREFLPLVAKDYVLDALLGFLDHPCVEVRISAMRSLAFISGPRASSGLHALLDDDTPTQRATFAVAALSGAHWMAIVKEPRVCDVAALALAKATRYAEGFPAGGTREERDAAIDRLRQWWRNTSVSMNWRELRSSALSEFMRSKNR